MLLARSWRLMMTTGQVKLHKFIMSLLTAVYMIERYVNLTLLNMERGRSMMCVLQQVRRPRSRRQPRRRPL